MSVNLLLSFLPVNCDLLKWLIHLFPHAIFIYIANTFYHQESKLYYNPKKRKKKVPSVIEKSSWSNKQIFCVILIPKYDTVFQRPHPNKAGLNMHC